MKKLMTFAVMAALILAAGCAEIENKSATNEAPHAIGFSHYTPKSLTKANDTYVNGNTLIANKTFAVYAWATTYGNFLAVNPGDPAFMDPAVVTWKDNNNEGANNTYTPQKYWPAGTTPDNLSFTAYYPEGGAGITAPTFPTTGDGGVGTYAFEAQDASANMVDFCVADVVNDQVYGNTNATTSGGNKGTVAFTFKHQLAKVQFKFKTDNSDANTTVELVDAELYNIKTEGTLTATYARNASPAVNALGTTTTEWSGQAIASTPITYEVFLNGSDPESGSEIELTTTANTVANSDIFLMVPQAMIAPSFSTTPNIPGNLSNKPQYLLVTWKVTTGGVSTTNTQALYLDECVTTDGGTTQANIDWAKNSFVTYTITIGPKPIYFTATVENWGSEQSGYFNVN